MNAKTYLVTLKAPQRTTQQVVATSYRLEGQHLVFLETDDKLAALFLLAIVQSWNEVIPVTETPKPASYEFSKDIGALCVKNKTNVYKLAEQLKVDPVALLKMINGKTAPTKQVIAGLAKALDSDVYYLEKLALERPKG